MAWTRVASHVAGASQRPLSLSKLKTAGWSPSQSRPGVYYRLRMDEYGLHCSCPDALRTCKHIVALQFRLGGDPKVKAVPALAPGLVSSTAERPLPASESNGKIVIPADLPATPEQLTYWQTINLTQTREKRLFKQLLHVLCSLVPEPERQAKGRPPTPIRDLVLGEVYREYSGLSSRRCRTDIEELAEGGYISKPYCHNTGTDFLNEPETTDLLRALITESARPLQDIERVFAPDSTGFSTSNYARWHDEKYGSEKTRATYVKTHILVGSEDPHHHRSCRVGRANRRHHDAPPIVCWRRPRGRTSQSMK